MKKMTQSVKVPVMDASGVEAHGREPAGDDAQGTRTVERQAREADVQQELAEEAVGQAQECEEQETREDAPDYKDLYLRTLAEFENYRRRAEREMSEFKKYANEVLIKEILPVIDNLERAMECTLNPDDPNCVQHVLEGVHLTEKEILKVLERHGVTQVNAVGELFNPAFHQALMAEESDQHPEETVIREMQKGYLLKERLIRPALVTVAKGKTDG